MRFKSALTCSLSILILAGCSSTDQVAMMADHRANVIESGLPYQFGPLNVMSAKAEGHTVELMMIYNQESASSLNPEQLIDASIRAYCSDNEVRAVLKKGVIYHVTLRSQRGQLLIDKYASEESCTAEEKAKS